MEPEKAAKITLITPDEVNVYRLGDSIIFYARVPSGEQARMAMSVGGRRDRTDIGEFNRKLCVRAIKGWKEIADPSGEIPTEHDPATPADRAIVTKLVERLPGAVIVELSNLTADAKAVEDDVVKN